MGAAFLCVANMSINAGYAILGVIILRLLLRKAPKIISYALWSAALFRMICPFSFESVISLLPSANTIAASAANGHIAVNSGFAAVDNAVNPLISASLPSSLISAADIFGAIWIVGIIGLTLYCAVSYIRLKRRVRCAVLLRENIFECENVSSPFVLGIIKPKIYLPFGIKEKSYISAHEAAHIKRLDHIIKPAAFAAAVLHWFNPLVWFAFALMTKDMEMSCDEKVIKPLGGEAKREYAASLLALATQNSASSFTARRIPPNGSPLAFAESNVGARIKNTLNYKKPTFWAIITAAAAVIIGACLIANPKTDGKIIDKTVTSEQVGGYTVELVLENGVSFTEEDAGAGGNVYKTNFKGNYILRVMKNGAEVSRIHSDALAPISFDGGGLNFPSEITLNFSDYNGDGNPDFALGQWSSSSENAFLLFSVNENGEISVLPVENGELYAAAKEFSPIFNQANKTSFEFYRYSNAVGENELWTASWNGSEFETAPYVYY